MFFQLLVPLGFQACIVASAVISSRTGPTVTLDSATFTGTTSGVVSKFLGIPFAQPPTGDRRFRLPETLPAYNGSYDATDFGPSCPQQAIRLPILTGIPAEAVDYLVDSIYDVVLPDDEDCLTINVLKPANATSNSKLPVIALRQHLVSGFLEARLIATTHAARTFLMVSLSQGGFELGGTAMYDGTSIVTRSITLDQPVIYVSMNYRVSGFGFLAGKEVKEAAVGNLGLHDQREALRWIQKYIATFGGDPTKVTLWGESAGAISAAMHMIAYDGDTQGLFHAAFMQSGSPIPVGDLEGGQKYYDDIVVQTGCSGSDDTLACLRTVSYDTLKAAIDNSPFIFDYQSLILAWLPRADGVLFSDIPQRLVQQSKIADVPIVSGDCDDEGTLFSLSSLNVTTDAEVETYLKTVIFPNITDQDLATLLELYPADPLEGSPYDTGLLNILTPQFKRIASFQGDAVFQAPRRFFLQNLSGKQNIWAFLSKRFKIVPVLGAFHTSDILNVYFGGDMADYLIRFAATLDPGGSTGIQWPQWTNSSPNLLTFNDGLLPLTVTQDTFRSDAMNGLSEILLRNPI
ncbi:carotenoid ester lipase precursor [Desarmillaria tabescens]|uniref:Carboxylic ester hydrolase n=1 Tax=Armillaria tabescens TaxID=1929756 RepID=A0AA39N6K6_ARMTA|nr:carotenoid ester lipase precursor [Desarmillaria tabescens]KAK0460036.1 carotenoid ester lipase precursor [Desarmillaria tabescens]